MELDSAQALYVAELRDMYNANRQAAKALAKMSAACCGPELRRALSEHAALTQGHATLIEQGLERLQQYPGGVVCAVMQVLVGSAEALLAAQGEEAVREAALLVEVQKVLHYQIAVYRAARQLALLLGREEDVGLLDRMLEEVAEASEQAWGLADEVVNVRAAA